MSAPARMAGRFTLRRVRRHGPVTIAGDSLADLEVLVRACTPEQLADISASLNADELAVVERVVGEVAGAGWRSSPSAMAHQLTRGRFNRWRYSELLARKFVDALEGRSKRQIWNLPARYGKSFIASKWGPIYALERDPTSNLILASYGDELANENAIFVRDMLVAHADVLTCRLRLDRRRMDRFVTDQGGGLIAAGIGSALTGFGGNGAVVDDPFKNWQEAHSEAMRERVWDWFRAVLRTRLETDDAWIIVVMTRWHEEDLTGKLVDAQQNDDGEEWEVVRLPAIADSADDPLGRTIGEVLEPERFSPDAVRARARALGSYLSSGLEQQLPSPEEGTDIMRGWWKWYDTLPPKFDDELASWDMKLKDKDSGDFVVGQWWGRTGPDFWLGDQLRGRFNFATTKAAIVLMKVRHPSIGRHLIENTGNGPEVMEALRKPDRTYRLTDETRGILGITDDEVADVEAWFHRGMSGLIAENPKGDKRARMRAQTPLIEAGHVHVPYVGGIGELVVNEAAAFPNAAHDDMVDAMSQGLKRLATGGTRAQAPQGSLKTPPPGQRTNAARGNGRTRTVQPNRTRVMRPR